MATAAEPLLLTVEQYRQLPDRANVTQELHWGQVVTLTRPKMRRSRLQYRIVELLRPKVEAKGIVAAEIPFRALPEYDLRAADVAFVSRSRWDAADADDNLHGSPELVIEVLSPSNTKAEIREKAALYLSTGAQEFWVVDPKHKTVSVATRDADPVVYALGDLIPLPMFGSQLEVDLIFSLGLTSSDLLNRENHQHGENERHYNRVARFLQGLGRHRPPEKRAIGKARPRQAHRKIFPAPCVHAKPKAGTAHANAYAGLAQIQPHSRRDPNPALKTKAHLV